MLVLPTDSMASVMSTASFALACFHDDIRLAVEVLDAAGCLDLIQIFDDGALVLAAAVLGVVHNAHIALGELLVQVVGNGVAQPHGAVVAVHLADLAGIGDQRVDVILHPDGAVIGVEHELACIDGIHILVVGHRLGETSTALGTAAFVRSLA